ncbi:PREDICTED: serine-rich adhesin for platelets [Eufriesea mexicana]|uniref:serine-rich adhesin for platelets n=1 Tax=Eufriesea mexicana TaxID=516756 RepID=UPI00083BE497|nr:PREDICTED: serine-rich adhesin for platelets [Eufriesea mexicana]
MKSIRGAVWLVPLAVGCMALSPQLPINSKSSDRMKQTKAPLYMNKNESNNSVITSNSSSSGVDENSIGPTTVNIDSRISGNNGSKDVDGIVSKPLSLGISATIDNDAITMLPSSSPTVTTSTLTSTPTSTSVLTSTSSSTNHNSAASTIELSSTSASSSTWSIADTKTELGPPVTYNRGTTTTARTTTKTSASTITINSSIVNTSLSASPTEASSRTIASNRDASTFLSSSKKLTTGFNEFTTTPASTSSKETRESPGKIRPQIKLTTNYTSLSETGVRLPEGASAALAKPTKYHYYPHNQHIYLLPECAVQQVCNAVYVRLNFTQPLCACPGRYRDPCSASLDSDDLHTTELVTDPRTKALTLVKTCEPVAEMRECRVPRDWSLLALQNVRTGKSHYLVICRCPDANILEGPMSHDQPTYASVPGIRVYGMMCVQGNRRGRPLRYTRGLSDYFQREVGEEPGTYNGEEDTNQRLNFPWYKVQQLMETAVWD